MEEAADLTGRPWEPTGGRDLAGGVASDGGEGRGGEHLTGKVTGSRGARRR